MTKKVKSKPSDLNKILESSEFNKLMDLSIRADYYLALRLGLDDHT